MANPIMSFSTVDSDEMKDIYAVIHHILKSKLTTSKSHTTVLEGKTFTLSQYLILLTLHLTVLCFYWVS